jgi:uncharacterized protein RhaS with RHS repeats
VTKQLEDSASASQASRLGGRRVIDFDTGSPRPANRTDPGVRVRRVRCVELAAPPQGPAHGSSGRRARSWRGVRYEFGTADATGVRLIGIVDRSGNRLRIERSGAQISRLVSPHGRTLDFTLDASNRVTSVTDHIGRQITYTDNGSAVSGKWRPPPTTATGGGGEDAAGSDRIRFGATGCDRVRPGATGCGWVRLGAAGCGRVRPGAAGCGWVRQHRVNRHCRSVSRDFPCVSELSNAVPDDRASCHDRSERCT